MQFFYIMNTWFRIPDYPRILFLALLIRVIAAVFSYGYGFHDDHFITVEVARSWVDGNNESQWLPDAAHGITSASGHSRFYPSILMYFMKFGDLIGLTNPVWFMFFIRLIHALYSLFIVHFGYRICQRLFSETIAKQISFLLALYWFMPMLSVRNLVEMVCIPPIMAGAYMLLNTSKHTAWYLLLSGFIAALSVSVRFQCLIMVGGLGLALLIQKQWKMAWWFGLGTILSLFVFQGLPDYLVWHQPFAEFIGYYDYNIKNSGSYPNGEWYNYILLVTGLLFIPLGFFMWYGFFKNSKKHLLIWLPALLFFIFHSYFPNKQERFILPCMPFMIIVGLGSWFEFESQSAFWKKRAGVLKALYGFFFVINAILLLVLSISSSKANRVDAMSYLRERGDVHAYIVETGNSWGSIPMPRFYLGKWCDRYMITKAEPADVLKTEFSKHPDWTKPNYVLFLDEVEMSQRIQAFTKHFGPITLVKQVEPSLLDQIMTWLNPVNENQRTFIYAISNS